MKSKFKKEKNKDQTRDKVKKCNPYSSKIYIKGQVIDIIV